MARNLFSKSRSACDVAAVKPKRASSSELEAESGSRAIRVSRTMMVFFLNGNSSSVREIVYQGIILLAKAQNRVHCYTLVTGQSIFLKDQGWINSSLPCCPSIA